MVSDVPVKLTCVRDWGRLTAIIARLAGTLSIENPGDMHLPRASACADGFCTILPIQFPPA
jgi:hypothetical protein